MPARPTVDPAEQRRALNRRLREALVEGAKPRSRRELGRGLTNAELRRATAPYPGDLPERS